MPQPIGEHVADMLVCEAVIDDPAPFASRYDITVAQQAQLMTERRLADPEQECQIAYAQLIGEAQGVQDASAGWVREDRERGGNSVCGGVLEDASEEWPDLLRMQALNLAALGGQDT